MIRFTEKRNQFVNGFMTIKRFVNSNEVNNKDHEITSVPFFV